MARSQTTTLSNQSSQSMHDSSSMAFRTHAGKPVTAEASVCRACVDGAEEAFWGDDRALTSTWVPGVCAFVRTNRPPCGNDTTSKCFYEDRQKLHAYFQEWLVTAGERPMCSLVRLCLLTPAPSFPDFCRSCLATGGRSELKE